MHFSMQLRNDKLEIRLDNKPVRFCIFIKLIEHGGGTSHFKNIDIKVYNS